MAEMRRAGRQDQATRGRRGQRRGSGARSSMAPGILDFILQMLRNQWRDSYRDSPVLIYAVPLKSGRKGTKSGKLKTVSHDNSAMSLGQFEESRLIWDVFCAVSIKHKTTRTVTNKAKFIAFQEKEIRSKNLQKWEEVGLGQQGKSINKKRTGF